jgi:hypothetical protein
VVHLLVHEHVYGVWDVCCYSYFVETIKRH